MIDQGIVFYFTPFPSEIKFGSDTVILGFGFEGQEDPIISKKFPELEAKRSNIDKVYDKSEEFHTFPIYREEKLYNSGLIYIQYPWKKKKEIQMGGVNFLREVAIAVNLAIKRIKDEGYKKIFIVLPNKFSPQSVRDLKHREYLYQFISTVSESIIYANNPYNQFKENKDVKIEEVTFAYFGKSQKILDGFFQKAITDGEIIGTQLANTRRLSDIPPNIKTPMELASDILNVRIDDRPSEGWEKIKVSKKITGYILSGKDNILANGFGLIHAVSSGSDLTPCILRLHYKPKTRRQKRVRKVVILGKGVVFDTGGLDLKLTENYENMEYDMMGAAIAAAIPFMAEEFNLPVEVIVIAPLVQNMIGPSGIIPNSIVYAYGGKSVQIINTDCEGRLLLADVIAYGEQKFDPDVMITVGSLGEISDFGPDFLKVGYVGDHSEKIRIAEKKSAEKVLLLPRIDYLNRVDEMHEGTKSDLINDVEASHTAPFVFLHNFFKNETNWFFVDVTAPFESDAQDYGAGPGFGLKFVWNLVKQYI